MGLQKVIPRLIKTSEGGEKEGILTITPGIFAEPGITARFIEANERGSRVNTDLSANWDYWPLLPLHLAKARAQLGIA